MPTINKTDLISTYHIIQCIYVLLNYASATVVLCFNYFYIFSLILNFIEGFLNLTAF